MIKGGPLFILGHGVIGQVQLCPPCEGMPRFALSSYNYYVQFVCQMQVDSYQLLWNIAKM